MTYKMSVATATFEGEVNTTNPIMNVQEKINMLGYKHQEWANKHPFLNAALLTTAGIALVSAMQVAPSAEQMGDIFSNFQNGLDNLGPQPVHAAGLSSEVLQQATPEPCHIVIPEGGTLSETLYDFLSNQGITDPSDKKEVLNTVIANNSQHPNPNLVHPGDTFNVPAQYCDYSVAVTPQEVMNSCNLPDSVVVEKGETFFSTVRAAIKRVGVSDPNEIDRLYNQIISHNRGNIPNPSSIPANTVVNIPDLNCNFDTAVNKAYTGTMAAPEGRPMSEDGKYLLTSFIIAMAGAAFAFGRKIFRGKGNAANSSRF